MTAAHGSGGAGAAFGAGNGSISTSGSLLPEVPGAVPAPTSAITPAYPAAADVGHRRDESVETSAVTAAGPAAGLTCRTNNAAAAVVLELARGTPGSSGLHGLPAGGALERGIARQRPVRLGVGEELGEVSGGPCWEGSIVLEGGGLCAVKAEELLGGGAGLTAGMIPSSSTWAVEKVF